MQNPLREPLEKQGRNHVLLLFFLKGKNGEIHDITPMPLFLILVCHQALCLFARLSKNVPDSCHSYVSS